MVLLGLEKLIPSSYIGNSKYIFNFFYVVFKNRIDVTGPLVEPTSSLESVSKSHCCCFSYLILDFVDLFNGFILFCLIWTPKISLMHGEDKIALEVHYSFH